MANISAVKKRSYTVTTADVTAFGIDFFIPIRITWPSSFYDTNYVISYQLEVSAANGIASYNVCSIANVSPNGFDANVYVNGTPLAGDKFVIHAMASHV